MAIRIMPDQKFLREALDYDPGTGNLTWRNRPLPHFVSLGAWKRWNTMYAGNPASATAHRFGHRQVCLIGQNWLAHRLIWKWMTGNDPIEVDHRKDASDNRWENLREAGYSGNNRNRKRLKVHGTGAKGVTRASRTKKERFCAKIRVEGKAIHLGTYNSIAEAHAAYCAAAKFYFGEFWSPG